MDTGGFYISAIVNNVQWTLEYKYFFDILF